MSKWPPKAPSKSIFCDSAIYNKNIFKTSISLKNYFVKERFGTMSGFREKGESIPSLLSHSC